MVKLTESIIFNRTKCNNIETVKKLNVWGCEIHDISIISEMPNLEVLSISVNSIDTLEPLAHCYNLKELYMRKNEVTDINQLDHLANLHKLKTLWLDDNPVAEDPEYRVRVLRAVPQLSMFDNRRVDQEEVKLALATCSTPNEALISSQQQLLSSSVSSGFVNCPNPNLTSASLTGNLMTSSMMNTSQYSQVTNPQMTQSMMLGRSCDETSFFELQQQAQQSSHHPGVQIIEGHTTPTHGSHHNVPPVCEVAIYNPTMQSTHNPMTQSYHQGNPMTQSYHQGFTQGYNAQREQQQYQSGAYTDRSGHGSIPENHPMDESWHDFGDEDTHHVPPMPRFGLRRSARSRIQNRSRSVSPGRIREGRMDSIMTAVCSLMDELDMDSLRHVIDEAHERIKKLR